MKPYKIIKDQSLLKPVVRAELRKPNIPLRFFKIKRAIDWAQELREFEKTRLPADRPKAKIIGGTIRKRK